MHPALTMFRPCANQGMNSAHGESSMTSPLAGVIDG